MKKDIKKIIAVSMLASTLTTTIAPFYTSSAVEGPKKYANGIFTGEAYGFYKKEHGKQPIRVDVEFNNDNIVSIKVHDDKEGYKFPDDKGFGGRAYTRVGPFLEKKLMYNKDYEETLKKIEEDLEFIYDDFSDRTKEKRKVYDTITSATKTSEGITKATLDAVSQSRRAYKKNELSEKEDSSSGKKENSDIMLIDINDKDKKSKILHIGEYIDLNDLSVNVKYSDGKIKRIGYKEFKDSGIGIGLILNNGKKIEINKEKIKINKENSEYKIIVYDKKSEKIVDYYSVSSRVKVFEKRDLYYRIGGVGEFKKLEKPDKYKISYDLEIDSSNIGEIIEFKTDGFKVKDRDESNKDEFFYKTYIIPQDKTYIFVDSRGHIAPEDTEYISPHVYSTGSFRIDLNIKGNKNINPKEKLDRLIEENKNTNNPRVKEIIEKINSGNSKNDSTQNIEAKKKELESKIKEKEEEYQRNIIRFKELLEKGNKGDEESKKQAIDSLKLRDTIYNEKEELLKQLGDLNKNIENGPSEDINDKKKELEKK